MRRRARCRRFRHGRTIPRCRRYHRCSRLRRYPRCRRRHRCTHRMRKHRRRPSSCSRCRSGFRRWGVRLFRCRRAKRCSDCSLLPRLWSKTLNRCRSPVLPAAQPPTWLFFVIHLDAQQRPRPIPPTRPQSSNWSRQVSSIPSWSVRLRESSACVPPDSNPTAKTSALSARYGP